MRIIAGRFKGVPLTTPRSGTRPTTDRTKEAIFSRLDAWGTLPDARVLDLYAGTGALGFEALSRGAQSCVFVESSAPAAKLVAQTATTLKRQRAWESDMSVRVVRSQAERYVEKMARKSDAVVEPLFDVVLIDPPYAVTTEDCNELLNGLVEGGLVRQHDDPDAQQSVIMLERSTRSAEPKAPQGWTICDRRNYGETAVFYMLPE
ncbi:RNA methyltransferase RsmD family [Bifidobacterium dolichotidis]|uniref:RNA methyltransferase RsmD family n=1 Tax=Bifidobacterium dolichotidis TaxID=2306976 RepID=A0A430FQL2_9BIFI|nr:16S rRNA (guanine(966)-N(2))-methyltransferase RsmD [Bifidobacterium dolichotidis]RSX55108.1 RNA methyltransferase RsmD family [Bifidobacterium dolichotidis]